MVMCLGEQENSMSNQALLKIGDVLLKLECIFCGRTSDVVVLGFKGGPYSGVAKTYTPDDWETEDIPEEESAIIGIGSTMRSVCNLCKSLGCTLAQKGIQSDTLRLEEERLESLTKNRNEKSTTINGPGNKKMTDEELRAKTLPDCPNKYLKRWMELFHEDFPYNEKVEEEEEKK